MDGSQLYTSIQDAAGNEIKIKYHVEESNGIVRDKVEAPGPNGTMTWAIDWEHIQAGAPESTYFIPMTDMLTGNIVDLYGEMPFNFLFRVVKQIQLPLGTFADPGQPPLSYNSYEFIYGPPYNGSGELGSMRMPSGSQYEYDYDIVSEHPAIIVSEDIAMHNAVTKKRITHDGIADLEWNFDYHYFKNGLTDMTAPDGGLTRTEYVYEEKTRWYNNLVTEIQNPDGSVLTRQWDRSFPLDPVYPYCWRECANNPIIVSETLHVPGGAAASTHFDYDSNGNLKAKYEYDWSGTELLRETQNDYFIEIPQSSTYCETNNFYGYGSPYEACRLIDSANAYFKPHNPALWSPGSARRLNAVRRFTISKGSTPYAATEFVYDNPYTSGNVFKKSNWDSVKAPTFPTTLGALNEYNSQVLSYSYDSYGNLIDTYEPKQPNIPVPDVNTRKFYSSNPAGTLITDIVKAPGKDEARNFHFTYLNRVAVATQTDVDNGITSSYAYDNVGRTILVNEGNQRRTVTQFDDANRKVYSVGDLRTFQDGKIQTITKYDQLGRVVLAQSSDGYPLATENDGIKVKTTYHHPTESGKFVVSSTPYRQLTDTTLEWTCTQYDRGGRVTAVAMFKGNEPAEPPTTITQCSEIPITNRTGITTTVYNGIWTEVTDPAGKVRKQRVDALGRLLEVVEDSNGLNYSTTYSYDPLGNLTQVHQSGQTRSFYYSSLSRLISADNPESGTIDYTYYDSGDLHTRTDDRNITSTMAYDPLHRVLTKSYSDGTPAIYYDYHVAGTSYSPNIGQLKSVSSSVASTLYGYTQLGQVAWSMHNITGYPYSQVFNNEWYLNGGLKSIRYPSGRLINYDVDDAGRTVKVNKSGGYYMDMTGIPLPYTPDGRIRQMKLGNNTWETRDYLPPGTTPTVYNLGTTAGAGNRLQLKYYFNGTANNGNLESQQIVRGGVTWTQNYTYDGVNRLHSVNETGTYGFYRQYGYDEYGNRWITTSDLNVAGEPTSAGNINPLNNRLDMTGVQYDAAGNQTSFGSYTTINYDAEGRISTMTGSPGNAAFYYDGDGRRVKKVWTSGTTFYFYDALGQLAVEYSTEAPASTGTTYPFTDMLGSVRSVTNQSGTVTECYDYLPFGRIIGSSINGRGSAGCHPSAPDSYLNSSLPQKFTGKERDETGLDYFGARYFSGAQGRFTSTDPVGGRLANPQSLNRYTYVLNNPLKFIDPTGMIVEWYDNVCKKVGGKDVCTSKAEGKYLADLDKKIAGDDKKARDKAQTLKNTYLKLDGSSVLFEVAQGDSSGSSRGDIAYEGNDHFVISLKGSDPEGLSDGQRLSHEFEHGRQILDGESSFHKVGKQWMPFAADLTDEALAFQAGFAFEGSAASNGKFAKTIESKLSFGIKTAVDYLHVDPESPYRNKGMWKGPLNVPPNLPPNYYYPPK
jgi:RHS repeat-associated protein